VKPFDRGFETARIESAVEISSDLKSGLGLGGAGIVEDLKMLSGDPRPVEKPTSGSTE
jgi:hypothetical protein